MIVSITLEDREGRLWFGTKGGGVSRYDPSAGSEGTGKALVTVTAEGDGFDGYADVYIDGKFIGTTDNQSRTLRIDLKKGEYTIIVAAEGFKPWKSKILMLGTGYKQSALARLKKVQEPNKESP